MEDKKIKEVKEMHKAKPKKSVSKPKYIFIKPWKTTNKNYKVGDGLFETNKTIVEFLLTKKTIK